MLDEKQASFCVRQVLAAVEFLHNKRIVHRDIKPANILVLSSECGLSCERHIARLGFLAEKTGLSLVDVYFPPVFIAAKLARVFRSQQRTAVQQ